MFLVAVAVAFAFAGLIIGPRGNTQKRMERETDCKIAIRGKGSVKEGARRGPMAIDEDDELHVYVSGETEEAVEKAAKEVGKLLRPLDDEQNEHKQKQLRELALINGTLREEDYCNICGEKGHRQFECPKRAQTRSATVEVRCALCGDTSHPTRDCLLHKSKQGSGQPGHEASLDKEYMSFMAELGDGDGAAPAPQQTGPRPPASSSAPASSSGGGSGGGGFVNAASTSKANHYVWTPPTAPAAAAPPPAATPAAAKPMNPPPAVKRHVWTPPTFGQQPQQPQQQPQQQRSPFSGKSAGAEVPGGHSSAADGAPLLPPSVSACMYAVVLL